MCGGIMKKKIAVFANTYNSDIITSFLEGFERALPKKKFDTFIFLAANSYAKPDEINLSETSIHDFPNLEDFIQNPIIINDNYSNSNT